MQTLGVYIPILEERPAGLGTYVVQVCEELFRQYAGRIVIFTMTPSAVARRWANEAEIVSLELPERVRTIPGARQMQRLVTSVAALPALCREHEVDVLFSPVQEGCLFPNVPQVVVMHDLTALRVPSAYFSLFARAYIRLLLPRVLRACARVIAVSTSTKDDLVELMDIDPASIEVVHEGVDGGVYRAFGPDEIDRVKEHHGLLGPYLLYSGTFASHKNTSVLPEILALLRRQGVDVSLAVTGRTDAGARGPFDEAAERHGVSQAVMPLGYVPVEDLGPLMAGAEAFLFPSLYEGFGLAPLEAMASGGLVLCSDRASLPEVVGSGGVLLNPQDARAWAGTLRNLMQDPDAAKAQRSAAFAQARRFTWSATAAHVLSVLKGAAAADERANP